MRSRNNQLIALLEENKMDKVELEDLVKRQMTELQMVKEEITLS